MTQSQATNVLPKHYTGFIASSHATYKVIEDAMALYLPIRAGRKDAERCRDRDPDPGAHHRHCSGFSRDWSTQPARYEPPKTGRTKRVSAWRRAAAVHREQSFSILQSRLSTSCQAGLRSASPTVEPGPSANILLLLDWALSLKGSYDVGSTIRYSRCNIFISRIVEHVIMRERHKQEQGILSKENDCCHHQKRSDFPRPFAPVELGLFVHQWLAGAPPPGLTLRRLSASGTAASASSVSTQKASM